MSKVKDSIYYFEDCGFLEDLTTDKKYYVKVLIKEIKRLNKKVKGLTKKK